MSLKVAFYRQGLLIAARWLVSNSALPEEPEADSMRIYSGDLDPIPEERPSHGPGCHCPSCIRILSLSTTLDDTRIAKRILRFMAEEIERWREGSDVLYGAIEWQIRKRWQMRCEMWRLRRELAGYRANDAKIQKLLEDGLK